MSEKRPDLHKLAESIADGEALCRDEFPGDRSGNLHRLGVLARLFASCRSAVPEPPFQWGGLTVESVLGRGGFGTVYRAWDPVLARYVALKLIDRAELAEDEFMAEARRLARVRHPNVLNVHGVEAAEDRVGLWGDLLEGQTLEQRLTEGPFSEDDLLAIVAQLVAALRAVHEAGLVHGDLKAGNVMIDDAGHVTLMDFGAAYRHDAEGPRFGSLRNLAPECAGAESGSFAADVYALGLLLYRLATGQHAFPEQARDRLLEDKRAAAFDRRGLRIVSRDLRGLIDAMLAPAPADRPDIDAVAERIDWIRGRSVRRLRRGALAALLVGLLAVAAWILDLSGPGDTADRAFEASLAVLPFENLAAESGQGDFVSGLSETILHALSRVEGLKVTGQYSVNAVSGNDWSRLGRSLGVDHLLHGSVRRAGDQLRVFAELVRASDGTQVWSKTFDRPIDDVFRIQDSIAAEVARSLRGVAIDPRRSDVRRTDVDIYEIYLRGLSLLNRRGVDNVLQSIEYFRSVIDRDPRFAPAWSRLASAYAVLPSYMNAPSDSAEQARAAANRALDLDPEDAVALGVLATQQAGRRQWLQADRLYRRALAAEPSNSVLHMWYGELLADTGRLEAKRREHALAVELDPLAPAQRGNYGWALLVNRDFEGAERECRAAWDLGLEAMFVWGCVHEALLLQERFDAAEQWIERLPLGERARASARTVLAALRDPADARRHAEAVELVKNGYRGGGMPGENAAMALGMLGETEAAWAVIDELADAGRYELERSLFTPHLAALHDDPRFVELMERLGLIDYWRATEWGAFCKPSGEDVECRTLAAE